MVAFVVLNVPRWGDAQWHFWSDIYESWEENKYHKNKYWRIFMLEIFLKGQIPRTQTGHTEIMSISRRPDNVG